MPEELDELEEQIRKELDIDDTNIDGEVKRQAGKFFYWGTLLAHAAQRTRATKSHVDAIKADEAKKYKEQLAKEDPKIRVTERMLDDFLDTNPVVTAVKDSLIAAQYKEQMLDVAVDAFRQRHYALIELSKGRESERMMQNEYNLMKKDYEAREAKKHTQ